MAENKSLFDKLKTLFSTNVVVRNVGGKKLKVVDTAGIRRMETHTHQRLLIDTVDYMERRELQYLYTINITHFQQQK